MENNVFAGQYRGRKRKDIFFRIAVMVPAGIVIALLFLILAQVVVNGAKSLNFDFFFQQQKPFGEIGGGIVQAIVGTLMLLATAIVIALPFSLLAALYLYEHKGSKRANGLLSVVNTLQGIPSIVIGVVIYSWVVVPMKTFSALSGGIALSIVMLPLMISMIKESLEMVPASYVEAALALGAPRWRVIVEIVLPAAGSGILEATGLGIARAAGETAPLLFTAFGNPFLSLNFKGPISALPLVIYEYIKSPYDDWHQKAWGAALLLVVFVLSLNLFIGTRKKR
ncbi:Phosphate transport system permease protein [uncultured spirochete]|jgi:phosphate transport system permease protein|uniref:Phosphate transport system permease protein PstA n=1 Tax=uncultured spirochete TaxID=156406 RepID=A0A3P3XMN4_9SPIR|nr:Phosphate transport system permease protein [uncultured spirochete]